MNTSNRNHLSILYLFVFATGATGLIYQVTWQKYLSRLLGNDNIATAIIMGTFLGGLSIGYGLCGHLSTKIKHPLKAYAYLEGIIALWCLAFPFFFQAVEVSTRALSFAPPYGLFLQGSACAVILILLPTICMGGTLPFLTQALSSSVESSTRVHSNIYATNTFGAFVGTLLAGFYLIPAWGLPQTLFCSALINLATFAYFINLSPAPRTSTRETAEAPEKSSSDSSKAPNYPIPLLSVIAFLSGFYVMTLENVLIRIVSISFGSSSYAFTMILAVFIAAIALGSAIVGRLKTIRPDALYWNQLILTVLILVLYLLLDELPYWAHLLRISFGTSAADFWKFYSATYILLICLLGGPIALMGATVPLCFHEAKRSLASVGKTTGALFSWNTFGNLLGSIIGGAASFYFLNKPSVFALALCMCALSAVLLGMKRTEAKPPILGLILLCISFYCIVKTPFYQSNHFVVGSFNFIDQFDYSRSGSEAFYRETLKGSQVLHQEDGPMASVAVIEFEEIHPTLMRKAQSLLINGKSDSSTIGDIYTLKLLAHLPALLAPQRDRVMVIGLGTGVTVGELTHYPDIEQIDVAEISPAVVHSASYFKEANYDALNDSRVQLHTSDAFRLIARSPLKWDIIISEPSNPWVTGVDLLFTREFYQQAKTKLTDQGVLLQWAHKAGCSDAMFSMILETLKSEFDYVRVFNANMHDALIYASNHDVSATTLSEGDKTLQTERAVADSLREVNIGSINAILLRETLSAEYVSNELEPSEINTMDHPQLHYQAGLDLFMDARVSNTFELNPKTALYVDDYLMTRRLPNWATAPLSDAHFQDLLTGCFNVYQNNYNSTADSVVLKAYTSGTLNGALTDEQHHLLQTQWLPFLKSMPTSSTAWRAVALENASTRDKAEALIAHVQAYRNWVSPYPIDGLLDLLKYGAQSAASASDRVWFEQALKQFE